MMDDSEHDLGVYFMKVYPHDERLRRLRRMAVRNVLDLLVARATVTRKMTFRELDKLERTKIGVAVGCHERVVANALSALSKPAHEGGVELLIRLGRGRYRLNPEFYFIGDESSRRKAMEMVAELNRMRLAEKSKKKAVKKKAEVIPFRIVAGTPKET